LARTEKHVSPLRGGEEIIKRVSYDVGYQTVSTFQSAFAFVMALQANELVNHAILGEEIEWSKVVALAFLIFVSVGISYLKSYYVSKRGERDIMTGAEAFMHGMHFG